MIVRLVVVGAIVVAVAVLTWAWRRREGRFAQSAGRFDRAELGLASRENASAVVVEFGGQHCGSCRIVESRLSKLSAEIPEMRVVSIDVEREPDLAERFEVRRIPTVFVTDPDLRVVWRASGVPSEAAIKTALLGPEWAGRPQPAKPRHTLRRSRRTITLHEQEGVTCEVPSKRA